MYSISVLSKYVVLSRLLSPTCPMQGLSFVLVLAGESSLVLLKQLLDQVKLALQCCSVDRHVVLSEDWLLLIVKIK